MDQPIPAATNLTNLLLEGVPSIGNAHLARIGTGPGILPGYDPKGEESESWDDDTDEAPGENHVTDRALASTQPEMVPQYPVHLTADHAEILHPAGFAVAPPLPATNLEEAVAMDSSAIKRLLDKLRARNPNAFTGNPGMPSQGPPPEFIVPISSSQIADLPFWARQKPHIDIPATIPEALIKALLFRDFVARRMKTWKLVTPQQWRYLYEVTSQLRRSRLYDYCTKVAVQTPFNPRQEIPTGTVSEPAHSFYVINRASMPPNREPQLWDTAQKTAIRCLKASFTMLKPLLREFHGLLIAAGGAVAKSLAGVGLGKSDVDLFFVDPDVEDDRSDEEKTALQNYRLTQVIAFLSDQWLNFEGGPTAQVFILRNEHVVTVHLFSEEFDSKYQFILRAYPSIGAVLGGFDIGPAMVAYTGWEIVATELGAWSALAQTLIVDISRRSTSFEHRISKYQDFCHLIFPGLSSTLAAPKSVKSRAAVVSELVQTIRMHSRQEVCMCGGPYCRDPSTAEAKPDYDAFEAAVRSLADLHGFEIAGSIFDVARPLIGDKKETLGAVLTRQARQEGYFLAAEEFIKDARANGDDLGCDCISQIHPILKLPRLEINQHKPAFVVDVTRWTVRPARDRSHLNYQLSDYYDEHNFRVCVQEESSRQFVANDYQDSSVWILYTAGVNLNALLSNSPEYTVSVTVLQKSGNNHEFVPGTYNHQVYEALQDCTVDVDNYPLPKDSRDKDTRTREKARMVEIIEKSLAGVNMGDMLGLYAKWSDPALLPGSQWPRTLMAAAETLLRGTNPSKDSKKLFMWRGDLEFFEKTKEETGKDLLRLIRDHLEENLALRTSKLETGPQWILRNPGRQWTASLNPQVGSPPEWYGKYYQSFRIGNMEMETTLRLCRLRAGNVFYRLPNDVFRIIVRMALWADAQLAIYSACPDC
jgi:hypothetical protein